MSELNLNPNSTLARKNIVDIALGVGITTLSLAVSYGVVAMHKVGELMRGDQVQPNALPSQQPSDVEATSTNYELLFTACCLNNNPLLRFLTYVRPKIYRESLLNRLL